MSQSLATAYPDEMERLRELRELYLSLGPNCAFAAETVRIVLAEATTALASQDVIQMIRCYKHMQGCK